MELIREFDNVPPDLKGGVLSIGVFDGVHMGHQKVLGRAVERAHELDAAAVVFTFHPHPLAVLRPDEAPPLIQTFGRKLELMREIGVAAVVWPRDSVAVLKMSPETFVQEVVCEGLAAGAVVEGADFRFGAGGAGDRKRLAELAAACGFEVESPARASAGSSVRDVSPRPHAASAVPTPTSARSSRGATVARGWGIRRLTWRRRGF